MKTLNNHIIKHLKGLAHNLKPVIIIGQNGVTEKLIKGISEALDHHELIKIKFNDCKEEKKELSKKIAVKTESVFVRLIGNVLTLYRQQDDEEIRKIVLPT